MFPSVKLEGMKARLEAIELAKKNRKELLEQRNEPYCEYELYDDEKYFDLLHRKKISERRHECFAKRLIRRMF